RTLSIGRRERAGLCSTSMRVSISAFTWRAPGVASSTSATPWSWTGSMSLAGGAGPWSSRSRRGSRSEPGALCSCWHSPCPRAGGVVQGGSALSQQLAKNLFLSNERTIERKVKEAFLALWLEFRLQKNEILKLYLDRAYLGGGTFGVDAAAQYYFNKSVREVTLAAAAMLAGLFKAPASFAQ